MANGGQSSRRQGADAHVQRGKRSTQNRDFQSLSRHCAAIVDDSKSLPEEQAASKGCWQASISSRLIMSGRCRAHSVAVFSHQRLSLIIIRMVSGNRKRMIRAGHPATMAKSGTFLVTTAPAAT